MPVGLIPYLFFASITAGFAFVSVFTEGVISDSNRRIIALCFAGWLPFAFVLSNTEEARYAMILLIYTALEVKTIEMLFQLKDSGSGEFVNSRLYSLYDTHSGYELTLTLAILMISFLVPLYLPFKWLRRIAASGLVIANGLLFFFVYDDNEIDNPTYLTHLAMSTLLLFAAIAVRDASTPLVYILSVLYRRTSPLCSVKTLA